MAGLLEMALITLPGSFELGSDVEQVSRARLVTHTRPTRPGSCMPG